MSKDDRPKSSATYLDTMLTLDLLGAENLPIKKAFDVSSIKKTYLLGLDVLAAKRSKPAPKPTVSEELTTLRATVATQNAMLVAQRAEHARELAAARQEIAMSRREMTEAVAYLVALIKNARREPVIIPPPPAPPIQVPASPAPITNIELTMTYEIHACEREHVEDYEIDDGNIFIDETNKGPKN